MIQKMYVNKLFYDILDSYTNGNIRYIVLQGGARAGKTFSILQLLLLACIKDKKHVTVISVSHTHLSRGAMRDFIKILNEASLREGIHYTYNRSNHIIHFHDSGFIEFISAERSDKLRGSQRDIAFINECNLLDYDFFVETDIRTKSKVFLDFNPVRRFWVHDYLLSNEVSKKYTYFRKVKTLENMFISADQLRAFESKLKDKNFRRAFWEGEVAEDNTIAFYNYDTISSEIIQRATMLGIGIDVGEGRSENAIVELYLFEDKYIANEVYYNISSIDVLCTFILQKYRDKLKQIHIFADNAAKDFINVARQKYNINVIPCKKIALDISFHILNISNIFITVNSVNLLAEASSLRWDKNKLVGKKHAIDGLRYILHHYAI